MSADRVVQSVTGDTSRATELIFHCVERGGLAWSSRERERGSVTKNQNETQNSKVHPVPQEST